MTATTDSLASVVRTRTSSSDQPRALVSKTESVPQSLLSSNMGTHIAPRMWLLARLGSCTSQDEERSVIITGWQESMTAPTTPWPFWISAPLTSPKPMASLIRCFPSATVRVSMAWLTP